MFPGVPVRLLAMSDRTKTEVGALVRARRLALRMSPGQLIEEAGIDAKTLHRLEDGTRWPQERTRLKIEPVLRWAPGSIDNLLHGKEPAELTHGSTGAEAERPTRPLAQVSDTALIAEISYRLANRHDFDRVQDGEEDYVTNRLRGIIRDRRNGPGERFERERKRR
jgi:hypothetical protein